MVAPMAWVRKLPSKWWQGLYKDTDGTTKSVGTWQHKNDALAAAKEKEQQAIDGAKEKERQIKRGEWIDPDNALIPFAEYATNYVATTIYGDEATRAHDDSYNRCHLIPEFGGRGIGSIDTRQVRAWVQSLPLAPATVQGCYQLLSRILRQAEEDRYISRNPCTRNIKLPRSKRAQRASRWLTRDELLSLADAIDPRFRCVILTMGYMGLRFGEVAGLTTDRVDLLHGTIEVVNSLQELRGELRLKEPKTKSSSRKLPLPPFLGDELTAHLEAYSSAPYEIRCEGDDVRSKTFVFTGRDGAPLRKSWAKRHFATAADSVGLLEGPPRLRPHHLRHTAVALLIAQGAREKELQEWCGHSSYGVTMDTYGHLFPERGEHLAALIDQLHRAPTPPSKVTSLTTRR
jgi:integrase